MRTPLIEKLIGTTEIHKILIEKILSEYENGQAEGESIHIADSANLPMILRPQGQLVQDIRQGYNSAKYDKETQIISEIEFTHNEDDSMKVNGTSTKYVTFKLNQEPITLKAGTHTLALLYDKAIEIGVDIHFDIRDNETSIGNILKSIYMTTTANSWKTSEITLEKETDVNLVYYVTNGAKIENQTIKFMLLEGTYTAENLPEYEKYGLSPSIEYPSEIKNVEGNYKIENINSNLYDINDLSEKNGNIQIDKDDWISGTMDNSDGSGYIFLNFFSRKKDYIKANKKYYVLLEVKEVSGTGRLSISSDFQGSSQFTSFSYSFSNLKSNSKYLSEITTISDFSKTIFALRSYLQFQSGESGSITFRLSLLNNKPNLEEFIYKKHRSKILELNIPKQLKLYGENDRFVYLSKEQATELELDGEGWYVYNEWGEIVIVGTEKFIEIESVRTPKTYLYQFDYTKLMSTGNNILIGAKCNYFNEDTANNIWSTKTDLEGFSLNINHTLHIRTEIAPDLFKTWLEEKNTEGNPLKVVGKLVNPTYTKITDKNFIKQLEELQKVFSHEGTTNIDTCSTDDKEKAPLIISAEYLKSQKIINKNLETRITALEKALMNNI